MINIPIFKRSLVQLLYDRVDSNLDMYINGDLTEFLERPELAEYQNSVSSVRVDQSIFSNLKTEAIGASDAFNANLILDAFEGMTPYLAADERIWTAVSHKLAPKYAFQRHSKANSSREDKIKNIKKHFFATGGLRGLQRDNAIARLWWYAFVCEKNKNYPRSEVLKRVLNTTDFRSSLLERPTSARVSSVFNAITNIIIKEYKNDENPDIMQRQNYRPWLRNINLHGGRRLYATMQVEELEELFRDLMP